MNYRKEDIRQSFMLLVKAGFPLLNVFPQFFKLIDVNRSIPEQVNVRVSF